MIAFIIFLIGLAFLSFFTYKDLTCGEVNNSAEVPLMLLSIFPLILQKSLILWLLVPSTFILMRHLWKIGVFGGADVKILPFTLPFLLFGVQNMLAGFLLFVALLALFGGAYAKLFSKHKSEAAFMPVLLLAYICFWMLKVAGMI